MTSFGFQIPGFRHAGGTDADMFDHTVAHATAGRGGRVRIGVGDGPLLAAARARRARRTDPRGVHAARRARGAHRARAARHARDRRDVPQPGAARQDGHDARHHLEGPRHPRNRRGVVRARARRLRLPRSRARASGSTVLEEAVQICRAMFRDDHVSWSGRHYSITDARNVPRPIQTGGPPIMIGGERREAHAAAGRAVRRHVQRRRAARPRSRTSSTCSAGTAPTSGATRRRSRRPGSAPSCSRAAPRRPTASRASSGAWRATEFGEQFTVGEADEVVEQVGALVDAGLDGLHLQHAALRPRHRRPAPATCSPQTFT